MELKLYIWSWINLHPQYLLKRSAQFLALAALLLLPLLYLNATILQRGAKLGMPGFEISPGKSAQSRSGHIPD